jgi:hypothetical protein
LCPEFQPSSWPRFARRRDVIGLVGDGIARLIEARDQGAALVPVADELHHRRIVNEGDIAADADVAQSDAAQEGAAAWTGEGYFVLVGAT